MGKSTQEVWKDIPGWPDYQAAAEGRIRSLKHKRPHVLKQEIDNHGYPVVWLYFGGRRKCPRVGALVLLAFVGPRPEGQECRHLDDNPLNNHLDNLAYGTHAENEQDKARNGNALIGERHWAAQLTDEKVREIRRRCAGGESQRAVARDLRLSQSIVQRAVARVTWSHITD